MIYKFIPNAEYLKSDYYDLQVHSECRLFKKWLLWFISSFWMQTMSTVSHKWFCFKYYIFYRAVYVNYANGKNGMSLVYIMKKKECCISTSGKQVLPDL
jgi:hypothetical protein